MTTREELARLLGADQDDRGTGAPKFAGLILHPKQAYAIADAILASDVIRQIREAAWDEGAEFMNSDGFWHDNGRGHNPYRKEA